LNCVVKTGELVVKQTRTTFTAWLTLRAGCSNRLPNAPHGETWITPELRYMALRGGKTQ